MIPLTRRELLSTGLAMTGVATTWASSSTAPRRVDIHEQILEMAARQQELRRARFRAVRSREQLRALQASLRETFLRLVDGLPASPGVPSVRQAGTIDAGNFVIEKLAYESLPGYFVPALIYRPSNPKSHAPGVLSPCGHSTNGKAAGDYQTLHVNLARRGFVVLTYDPVGQGERSQFWDARRQQSRFNRSCGEHAVLGNPLYLLGTSLARYRIWDGLRGLDYLASIPEVDPSRLGCVGNSGGGTLTAYIAALDPRVSAAAICCYITTLPRRMANRIQEDPSSDPEQDIHGFVSEGIDHAGLLALRAPRPTLIGSAVRDFFPIEGARKSFSEARRLYEIAGAPDRISMVEAPGGHGLSAPLRTAVYAWFEQWLAGRTGPTPTTELAVKPRSDAELLVCPDGQANTSMRSRPFLPMAWAEFERKPRSARVRLEQVLGLDLDQADPRIEEILPARRPDAVRLVCINGNESRDWREQAEFLHSAEKHGHAVIIIDPRGVGASRPSVFAKAAHYADPLSGVEENLAYNAFLVGRSLAGMRSSDVLAAISQLRKREEARRIVLCGRRDAALVSCLSAAVDGRIDRVACEEMPITFRPLFSADGLPFNAASIVPGLLQRFGDIPEIISALSPGKVLVASAIGEPVALPSNLRTIPGHFSRSPEALMAWLRE